MLTTHTHTHKETAFQTIRYFFLLMKRLQISNEALFSRSSSFPLNGLLEIPLNFETDAFLFLSIVHVLPFDLVFSFSF